MEYFEKNRHPMMINNNELLDTIIFSRIQFNVKVFVYIFHNLETSSNKLPINLSVTVNVDFPLLLYFHKIAEVEGTVKPLFSTSLCSG